MKLLVFLSTIALVSCLTCDQIRGNCTECLQTTGCVYCSSPVASGCFSSALSTYCSALQGTLNNCSVSGTPCVQHSDCNSCQSDSQCHWCDTPIGYCFDATNGGLVCSNLQGKWNPTTCASTPQPNTTVTNTSNVYPVDTQATCQDFRGTQCIGTIFYNVYVNATDTQDQMSAAAASISAMAGLPGVSAECRSFATLYNCGNIFKRCEQIPQSTVSVSIPPCRSLCEGFRDSCANVLSTVGVTVACDGFPTDQVEFLYNNKIYNFSCNNMIPSTDDSGWFPNKLSNSDFTQISSDNTTLIGWESTQDYTILTDLVFDTEKTVIEVVSDTVISQTVVFNQDTASPLRISAYSKAINVVGYGNYSICVDLIYGDFDSELICGEFLNGTHDYELLQVIATPKNPIENATFIINFTKPGISYFYGVSLQEQVPETPSNPFVCYEPLEYDANWEAKGTSPCALPCPYDEVWDDSAVLDSAKSMYVALSWIGIFLNLFLILTWTIFPEKRKYPERFVLYFSSCVMLVSISGVAQTAYTRQEIACYDHFTFANQSNSPYCGFLAVCLQIGASGGLAWWMSICISTWLMIRYHLKQRAWRNTEKYFHVVVWTYVGLSTIIPLAASHMGYWVGAVGCWVDLAYHSAFQFACFYVPEGICMVVSVILVADSTRIIRNVQKQSSALKTTNTKRKGPRFTYELRSVGFITIIFFNVLFLFSFKFHTFSRQDAYEQTIQDEVLCRSQGGSYEDCRKGTHLSAVAFWFNCFGIVIESIICFIFFGIRQKHLHLWRNLIFAKIAPRFVKPVSMDHGSSSASMAHTSTVPSRHSVASTNSSIQMEKLSSTTEEFL